MNRRPKTEQKHKTGPQKNHEQAAESARLQRYRSLVDTGIALTREKDISRILDIIIDRALEATGADAASIFLVENIKIDSVANTQAKYIPVLRFHRSNNRRTGKAYQNKILELEKTSIAGWVAIEGKAVRIDDCYNLPADSELKFNEDVDIETGYNTISMLAVPMMSSNEKIRGVLQLINKLQPGSDGDLDHNKSLDRSDVTSFSDEDEELMAAFASQASVAIENARLTEDIENLFESFIRASVTAIESRDPSTSGHSDRVAVFTVEFARAVHQSDTGTFKNVLFSDSQMRELRYAALLHDFGKIGVRESVLSKQLKLYPHEMETILSRLEVARAKQEMIAWKQTTEELIEAIENGSSVASPRDYTKNVVRKIDDFARQLQQVRLSIVKANQPQIVAGDFDILSLMSWINKTSQEIEQTILTPDEIVKLSLPKGTLTEAERKEIENHVTHTYHFLRQIAWTEDLGSVPDIAYSHHEKMDGSGYPRGLMTEHIPLQSKLMTIADIYDALTSMDRPYKPAVQPERAIDILYMEGRSGKLDLDLLKIFVEAEVWRAALGMRSQKAA
ncbi:MAG: HD domain-containing phosphohydrolase [Bdellovibrionales bacterium]|jgi:HD-GYP domain-containing protein (c-di-GMP phosphodiesterase class II)|nr:HD domain-containing phosphohydrolase [Bdellovibrionales bacterium]